MNDYIDEIASWKWDKIRKACESRLEPIDEWTLEGTDFLGTVFALTPSGKYYMPWACGNVTEEEARQDALWFEALEEVAGRHGLSIQSGEGDPCDLFASLSMSNPGKDDDDGDEFFEDEPSSDGEDDSDDYDADEEPKQGTANG